MKRVATVVDLFAGAGGESCGISAAYERAGMSLELHAVNHWARAIETHSRQFPAARHYCTGVDLLDPCRVVPGGRVDLLWASPECTHHSTARGGRPRSDQSRASAWTVLKWVQELWVRRLIVENVPEFASWGPLDGHGNVIQNAKGRTFAAWIVALQSLGYRVEWRCLNAADFGAPTTRKRLFVQAVRGRGARILWPEPTHAETALELLPDARRPWRAAAEAIDWSLKGQPLSERARPLAAATMQRIAAGIRRYWGASARPFLCRYNSGLDRVHSVAEPMPVVDCANRYALVEPFITQSEHDNRVHAISRPMPTVTCSSRGFGLVVPYYGGTQVAVPVTEPLPTVTARDRFGLVEPGPVCDVTFRMLQPGELAAAQGFPRDYDFSGTREDQVRQIGNAVCPPVAEALTAAGLERR